ncbi:MAG: phage holin family protein [Candidatus Tectomicrobia bacterium]|nr:phage holin family protein [Candidatus Tectomicrobia bacterium]
MLWLTSALTIFVLSRSLPGFRIKSFGTALVVAAVYGVLHLLFYRLLVIIAFLPYVITFGLFGLVINAFLLYIADKLIRDFEIASLGRTFLAAILLTLSNVVFQALL